MKIITFVTNCLILSIVGISSISCVEVFGQQRIESTENETKEWKNSLKIDGIIQS